MNPDIIYGAAVAIAFSVLLVLVITGALRNPDRAIKRFGFVAVTGGVLLDAVELVTSPAARSDVSHVITLSLAMIAIFWVASHEIKKRFSRRLTARQNPTE